MTIYSPIEQVTPFITRQVCHDRIAIFTITNLGRAAMDQWFQITDAWYTEAEYRPHATDRVMLALQDFSQVEAGITPYGRFKAQELVTRHPDLKGRSAIIIAHMLYISLTTDQLIRGLEGQIERHVFYDKAFGLKWLEEALSQPSDWQPAS